MDSNYFNSKKYIILLILICILFVIITIKAFDYMPKPAETYGEYNTQYPVSSEQKLQTDNSNFDNSEVSTDDGSDEDTDDEDEDEDNSSDNNEERTSFSQKSSYSNDFMEIPTPPGAVEEEISVVDTN